MNHGVKLLDMADRKYMPPSEIGTGVRNRQLGFKYELMSNYTYHH